MILGWPGSRSAARIDALERELAALHAIVTAPPEPPQDPRPDAIAADLAALARRLDSVEARIAADGAAVAAERAASADANQREFRRLRTELMRLQLEMTRVEDQTRKLAAGLLRRMAQDPAPPGVPEERT